MQENVLQKSARWPKVEMQTYNQRQLEKGLQHCDTHLDKLSKEYIYICQYILATKLLKSFAKAAAFKWLMSLK